MDLIIDLTGDSDDEGFRPLDLPSQKRARSPSPPQEHKAFRLHPPPNPVQVETAVPECGCLEAVPLTELCFLNCGHSSCKTCVNQQVTDAVRTRGVACCPACSATLEDSDLQEANINPDLRQQLQQMQLDLLLDSDEHCVRCPQPSCGFCFDCNMRPEVAPTTFNGVELGVGAQLHFSKFRFRCPKCNEDFCKQCRKSPYHLGMDCSQAETQVTQEKCRFCGEPPTRESAAGRICGGDICKERARVSCVRQLNCGHMCGGIRNESECLPCLEEGCCKADGQKADDYCNLCWTEDLRSAPCIALQGCQHIFHLHCLKKTLEVGYNGVRITLGFLNCPLCQQEMYHLELAPQLKRWKLLRSKLVKAGMNRLKAEGLMNAPELKKGGKFAGKPEAFAMHRYSFFECYKCKEPYFAGAARCNAQNQQLKREELVCGPCSGRMMGHVPTSCPKHQEDYVEYKCRFCCSVASFFCFGTTHFCDACHQEWEKNPGRSSTLQSMSCCQVKSR